ncbi:MAG TPA: hypothetical protein DD405_01700 [Desulfobacteraceae bacterium]|nr:hypothetical protein [Desulfobacteraceae bacterium]
MLRIIIRLPPSGPVKFKKLRLFKRSGFQRFLNFIIAQFIAEITYVTVYTCCPAYWLNSFRIRNMVTLPLDEDDK